MAVTNAVAEQPESEPTKIVTKGERARLPYALNPILAEVRTLVNERDTGLEDVLAEFDAALADDNKIDPLEASAIRRLITDVFARNAEELLVMSLLDESGPEPAQRAVEHIQSKRKLREQKKRGRK